MRKDLITTLISGTGQESKIVKLEKGFNRLRIVGEGAKIKLRLVLTKGVSVLE
ncbi:MAG: hypothetical protein PHT30_00555 [Bacilli bacterium]|nr:hypothetical protein [Bacilli bacterium]